MSVEAAPTHRERLLLGMAAALVEKGGLGGITVADVVRHARTSRRTFYEQFEDRDACYLALFDAAADSQMARVADAVRPGGELGQEIERLVGAWLAGVAEAPGLSASFVRDLPLLGRRGAERQHEVVERFAAFVVSIADDRDDIGDVDLDLAVAVVAGLRELVVVSVERGRDVLELAPVANRLLRAVATS